QSRILLRALEELGYTVAEPQEVVAQTAHIAVGTGDADIFPSSWDTLHATFVTEAGGDGVVTKVGTLIEVATIDINDISAENKLIADGEDSSDAIDKHVADWIAAHQAEYDGWLAEARKAAE